MRNPRFFQSEKDEIYHFKISENFWREKSGEIFFRRKPGKKSLFLLGEKGQIQGFLGKFYDFLEKERGSMFFLTGA